MFYFIPIVMAQQNKAKWKQKDLVRALEDIEQNKISFRQASARYNIPKSTLCDYASGKLKSVVSLDHQQSSHQQRNRSLLNMLSK